MNRAKPLLLKVRHGLLLRRPPGAAILWVLLSSSVAVAGDLAPTHLRCEYATDPLGMDGRHPRLYVEQRLPLCCM